MGNAANRMKYTANRRETERFHEEIEAIRAQNAAFAESYGAMARALLELDNDGWTPLFGSGENGFTLEQAKNIAAKAREMTRSNPLLGKGAATRGNYVFGKGVHLGDSLSRQPRFRRILDSPQNKLFLFSQAEQLKRERSLFTSGVHLTQYDRSKKAFSAVPFSRVQAEITDPDDSAVVWAYRISYSSQQYGLASGALKQVDYDKWVVTDFAPDDFPRGTIQDVPVDPDRVIIDVIVNNDEEDSLGVPDCLAAMPWAWAYSEGLKDYTKVVKALSAIAWLVKQKSGAGTANAAAKIAKASRGPGSTVVGTSDTELTSMPRSNAVDMTNLEPLAQMAASAMGVSTDAILSKGAAEASAATLSDTQVKDIQSRQLVWQQNYYPRVFRVLGVPEESIPEMQFPRVLSDPTWRVVQS